MDRSYDEDKSKQGSLNDCPAHLLPSESGCELDFAVLAFNCSRFTVRSRTCCPIACCSGLAIDFLANALHGALQVVAGSANPVYVVSGKSIANCFDPLIDISAQTGRNLFTNIPQGALCLVGQAIGAVAHFDLLFALAVFLRVQLGFAHHALHLPLRETAGGSDGDLLLAPGSLVACRDIENAVGIDVEGHLNLRDASRSRSNTLKAEVPKALVVTSQFALTLQHMHIDGGLAIFGRAEGLALARRDGCVALDQAGHHASQRLHSQRERGDVKQEHVLHLTLEHTCLNGRAHGHHFIVVDALMRLLAKDLAYQVNDSRHAGLTTHQDDLV